jgi:transitional endoplasmic reticulum ATPase
MFGRRRHKGKIGASIVNAEPDKNERFILQMCVEYLKRHINRFPNMDRETLAFLCWILGNNMEQIGGHLLEQLHDRYKARFEEELSDCSLDPDEYSDVVLNMLRKAGAGIAKKNQKIANNLLELRSDELKMNGKSEIRKNVNRIAKMFNLSETEERFCTFLFMLSTHDEVEYFFVNHLECNRFSRQKYLTNILELTKSQLNDILTGTLKKVEMFEIDRNDLSLKDEFLNLFQNPSDENISETFFKKALKTRVELSHHFISTEQIEFMLDLLKDKPETSNHILLYGPPGTGKSSLAQGLCEAAEAVTYEIVKDKENTTQKRRAAILACLNMTNTGKGSIIVVDEADNILNTHFSWFARGETQDKGWLNNLLEEPGVRMIWVTNDISNIEDSVLRRFAFSLKFKPFNKSQRIHLWNNIVKANRCKRFLCRPDIETLGKKYKVSAGAIDMAVRKAVESKFRSKKEFQKAICLALDAHQTLMNFGDKPVNKDRIEKNYSLDGLNIHGDIHATMGQLEKFDRYLKKSDNERIVNMNLLFSGPPGTGKSELARYMAEHLNREIICKQASDLQGMYVGETEKNIKRAFEAAEADEAILVIDEVDTFLFSRDRAVRSWEISSTNEFLTQMERFRGILVCTTNRLKDLDSASIRRFNHKIAFDYLNASGNVIFYQKMLQPLMRDTLSKTDQSVLSGIPDLCPGDFKIVRDRYSFYPAGDLRHQDLILALEKESEIKRQHRGDKAIGF